MAQSFDSGNIDRIGTGTPDDTGRVLGRQIKRLWDDLAPTYQASRDTILFCQDVQAGRDSTLSQIPPDTFDDAAADKLVVRLPQRKMLPLNMTNILLGKGTPTYSRFAIGRGLSAQDDADDLEKWLNSAGDPAGDHEKFIKKGTQQGEYCTLVYPTPADYFASPEYLDELTEGDLQDLAEKERSEYIKQDSGRYRRMRGNTPLPQKRFQRDKAGKRPDDAEYAGLDNAKSKQAWKDEQLEYLAAHFPITVRILSATEYIPVYGPGNVLEGVVCRTLYTENQLIKKRYQWGQRTGGVGPLMIPEDAAATQGYGVGRQIFLYEYHGSDVDGNPYIAYSCGGYETIKSDTNGGEMEAFVDLRQEYGQRELLANIEFGLHFDETDPSQRGVPYLDPFLYPILNSEEAMTNTQVYLRRTAYPAFGLEVDPNMPEEKYLEADGVNLRSFDIPQGGGVVMTPGKLMPLGPGQVSPQVFSLIDRFMAQIDDNSPASTVFGGGNPNSGRETVVSRGAVLGANQMILEGARRSDEFRGEAILKVACALIKKFGAPIPVEDNIELGPEDGNARRRELLELNPDWVGSVYKVHCAYPETDSSIAEIQQEADLADRGFSTFEEVRSLKGDKSPETTRAKVFNDHYYGPNGPGYPLIAARAAKLRADQAELQRMGLLRDGKLTPGGTPTAALPPPQGLPPGPLGPLPAGAPPMGQPSGMTQLPNFAASSLGGQVAGAMQSGAEMGDAQAVASLQHG